MPILTYTPPDHAFTVEVSDRYELLRVSALAEFVPSAIGKVGTKGCCVTLKVHVPKGPELKIDDLVGNGRTSGCQGRGLGALVVNTALAYLKTRRPAPDVVTGLLSPADDPTEEPAATECRLGRAAFWQSFGFEILVGSGYGLGKERIRSPLSRLTPNGGVLGGDLRGAGASRVLDLDAFEVSSSD